MALPQKTVPQLEAIGDGLSPDDLIAVADTSAATPEAPGGVLRRATLAEVLALAQPGLPVPSPEESGWWLTWLPGSGWFLSEIHTSDIADLAGALAARDAAIATVASDLAAHASDTANPHGTTAAQVGAYSTAQVDTLLADLARTPGPEGPPGPKGDPGPPGTTVLERVFLFGQGGDIEVGQQAKWRSVRRPHTLVSARVLADLPPSGQPIVIDLQRTTNPDLSTGLTSLWSSDAGRPQLAAGAKVGATVTAFDSPTGVADTYYRAEVLQTGSPTPGKTVTLELEILCDNP